jgi:hypothetical protein
MSAPYYRCIGGDIIGRHGSYVPAELALGVLEILADEPAAAKAAGADEMHDRYVCMGRDLIDARIQAKLWRKASQGIQPIKPASQDLEAELDALRMGEGCD